MEVKLTRRNLTTLDVSNIPKEVEELNLIQNRLTDSSFFFPNWSVNSVKEVKFG